MAITLFPEQVRACEDTDKLRNEGHRHVLTVLPTGVGKTIMQAEYARRAHNENNIMMLFAHRDVLLGQLSDACCLMGVSHSFICSDKTVGLVTNNNRAKFGDSFHNEHSGIIIVSVDTFLARVKKGLIPDSFLNRVSACAVDEAHHVTRGSKWGRCVEALPNARAIGFTATPIRGDKKGLGFHADGYFNAMSVTSSMIDSIRSGRLTAYKILAPDVIDTTGVKKDKDGDYNKKALYMKTKDQGITGSAVEHYKKHLDGQPVITFGINIEHCIEIAKEFNAAGVPSLAVSSKSPDSERQKAVADLRAGRLLNLVNCDLFGEGFDAPAVMGVIMLRRTESYSLFKQQFGRMLRNSEGKVFGLLLDHVGNTKYFMEKYGLSAPHDDPEWTLDRVDNRKKPKDDDDDDDDRAETITCGECSAFGLVKKSTDEITDDEIGLIFIDGRCPECGHCETDEEKEDRKREIKTKSGELVALEFDVIESLISQRNASLRSVSAFGHSLGNAPFKAAAMDKFARKQHALSILRHWIQEWCTKHGQLTGQSVSLVQLDFEIKFGINIFKAQALTDSKMSELSSRIQYQVGVMK
mgnify:CR=1 FL=1